MKKVRRALSTSWLWLAVLALLLGLALLQAPSLRNHMNSLVLGTPCNDLFDEINIHTTVTRNLLQGKPIIYSDNLDYPINRNLLITHKTFLHIIFVAPLIANLPWPLWWNLALLAALVSGALAACYTLVKLSRSWMLGVLLGISFMSWQWLRDMVAWGHLVQLWSAPLFLAILFLVLALRSPRNARACWGLGICTAVTSLIFWIWGGALALLGVLGLIYYWPKLERRQIRNLLLTVAITALVLTPLALYVLSINPNLPKLQQGGGLDQAIQEQALYRASSNAVVRTGGTHYLTLPASGLVAPLVLILPLAGLVWAVKSRQEYLFWGACAAIFFVIGWGPYCAIGPYTVLDQEGRPVLLPFYYLMEWSGLGYRWQTPGTLTPVLMMCLALGAALAWQQSRQRLRVPALGAAIILSTALLAMTVQGADGAGRGNNVNPNRDFFPTFSFHQPAFLQRLAALPPGALLELPLGYVSNVWQLQHLHGHPTCHGRHPVASVLERNDFALWLFRDCRWRNRDLPLNFVPDVQSCELCYGQRDLPAQLCFSRNRYPSLARPLQRSQVEASYRVLREELQIRYAVLHRANCNWLAPGYGDEVFQRLRQTLLALGSKPLGADDEACLFELPSPTEIAAHWDSQPWNTTLEAQGLDLCTSAAPHGPIPE